MPQISRTTFSEKEDTYPQLAIRRTQAGGAFALVQVEHRRFPVCFVATHNNSVSTEMMDLGGWIVGDSELRPPEDGAGDTEYCGDVLCDLNYQEWRDLMIEWGGGVYVGRLGRAYFLKVVNAEASRPDELEVESWEGTLIPRPGRPSDDSQCIAELRPLEAGEH